MKIYCPKCEWKPEKESKWYCSNCGHRWNTFDTYGTCPSCNHIWKDTQCLECKKWSKHHHWYHDFPEIDIEIEDVVKDEE